MIDLTTRPVTGNPAQDQFVPAPATAWEASNERMAREQKATAGDYLGSMWRQDSITEGLVAHMVGSEMAPAEGYSVYEPTEWKDVTQGVWPEFQKELAKAHSPAHARYLKDLLIQKQDDLTRLGDMGWAGNIGRIALGVISPENLAMGYVGGLAARGIRGVQLARATANATGALGKAAAKADAVATIATTAGKPKAIAGGMAVGAAENVAFEKLRQEVNFEDDNAALMEAALIGAAFTAPFAIAGARAEKRVAEAARTEHRVFTALKKVNDGETLTPAEAATVRDAMKSHQMVMDIESGRLTPEEAFEQRSGFQGPRMPDDEWLKRQGDTFKAEAEAFLDELIPGRVTERTAGIFKRAYKDTDLLALGYDPVSVGNSSRSVGPAIEVNSAGAAKLPGQELTAPMPKPRGMSKLEVEAAIRAEAAKRFPSDELQRSTWATEQRQSLLGHQLEKATPIAKGKAAKQLAKALGMARDAKAKQTPQAPEKAPAEATTASESSLPSNPTTTAPEVPVEAPVVAPAKAGPEIGRVYDFNNRNGDTLWGELKSVRDDGWWLIEDEDGKVHPVHPSKVAANQEAPEGFLPGSVGAAQVAAIQNVVRESTAMRSLRLDYFSILDRSESELVRELSAILIKDPIQSSKTDAQGMTASEWKSHYRRTVGGLFHVESREAAREAAAVMKVPLWKSAQFNFEFHSMVSRLTRGDKSVLIRNPDIAPMLQRASAAQQKVYREMLEEAKRLGVKGVEDIDPNDFYVNRVWKHQAIREAIEKHGADAVHDLLAKAINVPGFIGDKAKAASFLHVVQKLEFSKVLQNVHLYAQDMGTLRGLLAQEGLQPDQIDLVVDTMFTAKEKATSDTGRAANLKYRFDIEETLGANTPAGILNISDLFENDSRVLVDSYLNTMGGHLALAKKGIYSEADFQARMNEIQEDAIANGRKGVDKDELYLNDIFANIVGRPMSTQDFSMSARSAAAFRGYTRSTMLGQLGLTAMFEMKQAVGLMGFRAFWQQLPAFRGLIQALRNGYIPDNELATGLMHFSGFGSEMSSTYARLHEVDEGFLGQQLSRVEHFANTASHVTNVVSGNASFTSLTRQFSSMMATQKMFDHATGKAALSPKMRERMVGWGVDDHLIDPMLKSLKDHTAANTGGKVETIKWEKWLADEPGHYETFQTLITRMTRDVIQDQDLGETMPIMHQTLGKLFFELRGFFLVAHAKNSLKNLHYRDATAFQVWAISFMGEMLAYSTQASLNYAHDPDKLAEMLTPEKIAMAAFMRSPVNGMLPFFTETGYQIATGGESLVGPEMTANTGSRSLLKTPSMMAAERLWAAPSSAVGLMLDNGNVTRAEGKALYQTLPLSNMMGARNLGSILTESLPKAESPNP